VKGVLLMNGTSMNGTPIRRRLLSVAAFVMAACVVAGCSTSALRPRIFAQKWPWPYPNYTGQFLKPVEQQLSRSGHRYVSISFPSPERPGKIIQTWPFAIGPNWEMFLYYSSGMRLEPHSHLVLASGLPKKADCASRVSFLGDGNVTPLLCSNGGVNAVAWNFYALSSPAIFGFSRSTSYVQVERFFCGLIPHSTYLQTYPEMYSEYKLAASYYGWSFSSAATLPLPNAECRRVSK
jgi:hypothetical protein